MSDRASARLGMRHALGAALIVALIAVPPWLGSYYHFLAALAASFLPAFSAMRAIQPITAPGS